jgi:putative DNA primase/helicase
MTHLGPEAWRPLSAAERTQLGGRNGQDIDDTCLMPVPADAGPPPEIKLSCGTADRKFTYLDAKSNLLGYVFRWEARGGDRKKFRPVTYWRDANGRSGWRCKAWPGMRPLFGLERLAAHPDAIVLLVEGEKTAEAVDRGPLAHAFKWRSKDVIGVTWPGGGAAIKHADFTPLAGREVVILPDGHEAGEKTADEVVDILHRVGVRLLRRFKAPAEAVHVKDAWDIADAIPPGFEPEGIVASILCAPEVTPPKLNAADPGPATEARPSLESAPASTFKMRSIRWLWNNRFALGKLSLIGGLPDQGKGQITSFMMAKATMGGEWPCKEGRAIKGNVLLLSGEDDAEDTIIPRLVAAGADCKHVEIVKMVRQDKNKRMFSLVTDLDLLRRKIAEVGDVVLIVIDPISAYLGVGKIDSYRTTDVRGVLSPLTDMAAELRLAIVGVMHFNKKTDVHNAMLRISDSLAYVATSRSCYVVIDDPENNRKLFMKAKNNLAPDMAALSYTFSTASVGRDPETHEAITAPYVVWGSDYVNVTATEAMQAETTAGRSSRSGAKEIAKKFLADMLANGPVLKGDIEDAAEGNGISERTLFRAKADLNIEAKKDDPQGGWRWHLPEQKLRQDDDR